MDIFSVNRINFSDQFYASLFAGINNAYYDSLSESGKRNYRYLLNILSIENGKVYIAIKSKKAGLRKHRVELIAPNMRDKTLAELYNNKETTKNGRDSFYQKVIERYANISRRFVMEWLKNQENWQLHVIQPREKVLRPIGDKKINSRWQIDLIDMQKYKSPQNHQRAWLFIAIDVFSKFVYVRAITQKTAIKCAEALRSILEENFTKTGEYPRVIQSDNGVEFKNNTINALCNEHDIKHIFSLPYLPQAQAVVERFNRTLKRAIFSDFTRTNSTRFFAVLPELVKNYNETFHTSIQATPAKIHSIQRANARQQELTEERKKEWIKSEHSYKEISRGDYVRLHILTDKEARKKKIFAKKYVPQWSRSIYEVIGIRGSRTNPDQLKTKKTYKLIKKFDDAGAPISVNEPLIQGFYRHDLLKINLPQSILDRLV